MSNQVDVVFDQEDIEKNKTIAALSRLGILFFLPMVSCPDSEFAKFHANQGLLLLIVIFACGVAATILGFIPFIRFLSGIVYGLASLVFLALAILGIMSALKGEAKELPIIGHIQILK